ncbi:Pentatricopeptide repeat-containing protein, partial [Thalictrum thalictroides]
ILAHVLHLGVDSNIFINGHVRSGKPNEALKLFRQMRVANVEPDEVTMIGVVSSCAQIEDLSIGREFHRYIEESGVKFTVPLCNAVCQVWKSSASRSDVQ